MLKNAGLPALAIFGAYATWRFRREAACRRASVQKSRYLAMASHELRQPLHVAMIGIESAIPHTGGKARANLERAQRATQRLAHQLDTLTGVVRADLAGGDIHPRIRAVSLATLFRQLDDAHHEAAVAKGLRLDVVGSSLVVASDPDALFTIVGNLVMNAIHYTESGRVTIGCRHGGPWCRIEVHDTGPGIAPENQIVIFDAFRRLEPRTGGGLGLGLTIVKETAALLGHALAVRSAVGSGSCFSVQVPLWNGGVRYEQGSRH